ncbi:HAMP domain-containing protein [Mangrovicoccus sp. HB182678]|uniref:histidine kinase n=1 Tax=Mangrovicoccus algicola TaxID=2771008 RepID=A0A8J7CZA8_9RHOB|nr:HAMP domain-containing protein [Mangrovicoccus algicola]
MTSLGARIAALMIVAILAVTGLATLAASRALTPPPPQSRIEPIARQMQILARLAEADPAALAAAGARIGPRPAAGSPDPRATHMLARALEHTGPARRVQVSRGPDLPAMTASVALAPGAWLVLDMPDMRPPDDGPVILAIWLAVILAGSAVISLYAAQRLVRPLRLLETAAGRIGADATLAPVPETGPAEVRATARALNRLSERLRAAMESRMRLVAAAGHDLRTPMTRMRLRAEFVEDETDRAKWLADLEELDRIADSAIRLVREEVGGGGAEPVRLDHLLAEIVTGLAEAGHPVSADPLPPLSVRAGPLALKRALSNLVLNAATHGGGAHVSLAERHGSDGARAVVTIRDDGPGLPEEMMDRVFEPFFRVDPARRKTLPGAGLGLAIAREILERFGGRIEIANLLPRGLLQSVTLPLAGPDTPPQDRKAPAEEI